MKGLIAGVLMGPQNNTEYLDCLRQAVDVCVYELV